MSTFRFQDYMDKIILTINVDKMTLTVNLFYSTDG